MQKVEEQVLKSRKVVRPAPCPSARKPSGHPVYTSAYKATEDDIRLVRNWRGRRKRAYIYGVESDSDSDSSDLEAAPLRASPGQKCLMMPLQDEKHLNHVINKRR